VHIATFLEEIMCTFDSNQLKIKMKNTIKLKSFLTITLLSFFTVLTSFTGSISLPSNANVTIPANQEFVLGEYEKSGYRARLINKSDVGFEVLVVNKKTNERTQGFGLDGNGSATVHIRKDEKVLLKNPNDKEIIVRVKLSTVVSGMGYQELGAYEE
jgi:hypothetical protein